MLSIRSPGRERRPVQVDLSEHAVQVQVEAGEEVARPEPEARREDAGVSVGVRRDEVRRVPVDGRTVEGGEQRVHALRLVEAAQRLQRGERVRHAREPRSGQEARPRVRKLGGRASSGPRSAPGRLEPTPIPSTSSRASASEPR